MSDRYPLPTELNWSEGLGQSLNYANSVTASIISNLFLLGIAFLFASGYWISKRDGLGAFAVGSFMAWLVGIFMFIGQFVGWLTLSFTTVLMILSFVLLWIDRGRD